jgi:hypothetical protein
VKYREGKKGRKEKTKESGGRKERKGEQGSERKEREGGKEKKGNKKGGHPHNKKREVFLSFSGRAPARSPFS